MELNFIATEKLLQYDHDKHFGKFVYLMREDNGYRVGLFFGGINGWERLTVDDVLRLNVSYPLESKIEYVYCGQEQTYLPDNWSDIEYYCVLKNNIFKDAGHYTAECSLSDTLRYQWSLNGYDNPVSFDWEIKPYRITEDNISVRLDKNIMHYDDELPVVKSVICSTIYNRFGNLTTVKLIKDRDYVVSYPEELNVGLRQVRVDLIGEYSKNYVCDPLYADVRVYKRQVPLPTNLNQYMVYDFNSPNYNYPVPNNWDDIKKYCEIRLVSSNTGDFYNLEDLDLTVDEFPVDDSNYGFDESEYTTGSDSDLSGSDFGGSDFGGSEISDGDVNSDELNELIDEFYSDSDFNSDIDLNIDTNMIGEIPVNVGEYVYAISLKDKENCVWADGSDDDKELVFTITPQIIEVPDWTDVATSYVFDGTVKNPKPNNWLEIKNYVQIISINAITGGTYTVKLTPRSSNFMWSDETFGEKVFEYTILVEGIEIPIPSTLEYEYNGYEHEYLPDNWDNIKYYCDIEGNKQTDSGEYSVTVSLKYPNELVWRDGTNGEYEFTFKINKGTGYFSVPIRIETTAVPTIGDSATVIAESSNGDMTYTWYRFTGDFGYTFDFIENSCEFYSNEQTITFTADDYNHGFVVVVSSPETENYEAHKAYALMETTIEKKNRTWKLHKESDFAGIPSVTYQIQIDNNTDDCQLIYSTESELVTVDENGVVTLHQYGTAEIEVSSAETAEYKPRSYVFTLTIGENEVHENCAIHWGFGSLEVYNLIDDNSKKLTAIPENSKQSTKLPFTMDISDYMNENNMEMCKSFWIVAPQGFVRSIIELGGADIYEVIKRDVTYVDETSQVYDVFMSNTVSVISSDYVLNIL